MSIEITRIDLLRAARNGSLMIAVMVVFALLSSISGFELPAEILLTIQAVYLIVKIINLTSDVRDARLVFDQRERHRR